jgi:CspA family cold shock protein
MGAQYELTGTGMPAALGDWSRSCRSRARPVWSGSNGETDDGYRYREVVQSDKGYGFIQPSGGGSKDVFVHISVVERAGLRSLNEGQAVEYEIESNRGKESAVNLKVK